MALAINHKVIDSRVLMKFRFIERYPYAQDAQLIALALNKT